MALVRGTDSRRSGLLPRAAGLLAAGLAASSSSSSSGGIFFAEAAGANPLCLTADAMIGGMRHYILDWDKQLIQASNSSWTCEDFARFMYSSR